jgi:hypothetical protein
MGSDVRPAYLTILYYSVVTKISFSHTLVWEIFWGLLLQSAHFSPWHASVAKEPTVNTKEQAMDTLKGPHRKGPMSSQKAGCHFNVISQAS